MTATTPKHGTPKMRDGFYAAHPGPLGFRPIHDADCDCPQCCHQWREAHERSMAERDALLARNAELEASWKAAHEKHVAAATRNAELVAALSKAAPLMDEAAMLLTGTPDDEVADEHAQALTAAAMIARAALAAAEGGGK